MTDETLRPGDDAVVARYLQVRGLFHNGVLARLEELVPTRYEVELARRAGSTLLAQVRTGFTRPDQSEIWPVIFLGPGEIRVALCVQITPEQLSGLGTALNGPYRLRQRNWEDWWGWEKLLAEVDPQFFDLPGDRQQELLTSWALEGLEWLAHHGLLRRLPG